MLRTATLVQIVLGLALAAVIVLAEKPSNATIAEQPAANQTATKVVKLCRFIYFSQPDDRPPSAGSGPEKKQKRIGHAQQQQQQEYGSQEEGYGQEEQGSYEEEQEGYSSDKEAGSYGEDRQEGRFVG